MTATRGLVDRPGYDLAGAVLESWDAFLALVDGADLSARTRLPGWTVREVAVHLGTWDGRSSLSLALESLRAGATDEPSDPDAYNAEVVAAHADATDDEVRAALQASRDEAERFLASDEATQRGTDPVVSVLGTLPLLTFAHACCYELAVHALDVADAIDAEVDPRLLAHGLAALTDSVGGLAARSGIASTVSIVGGDAGWSFTSVPDGSWTVEPATDATPGPRISGAPAHLLEAASGRADAPWLLARRKLHVTDIGGLLALAPILDQVPGVAGAGALKLAARSLGGVGSAVGNVLGRFGRRR